jgi:hypothetical protein
MIFSYMKAKLLMLITLIIIIDSNESISVNAIPAN